MRKIWIKHADFAYYLRMLSTPSHPHYMIIDVLFIEYY